MKFRDMNYCKKRRLLLSVFFQDYGFLQIPGVVVH
jgi:hypothetical protein